MCACCLGDDNIDSTIVLICACLFRDFAQYLCWLFHKNLEFSPRPSVRPSVRPSATAFFEIRSLLFSETLQLIRAFNSEKNVPNAFLKTNPVSPILAKNCPKLAIWLDVCNSLFKGWESLKNLNVGVFDTDFKQFVLQQTTHTYSDSWGPVENFFHPPTQICVKKIFPLFLPKNIVSLLQNRF